MYEFADEHGRKNQQTKAWRKPTSSLNARRKLDTDYTALCRCGLMDRKSTVENLASCVGCDLCRKKCIGTCVFYHKSQKRGKAVKLPIR